MNNLTINSSSARSEIIVEEDQTFTIETLNKSYRHQYANIYFLRLKTLRSTVEARSKVRWENIAGNPKMIPRVLEVVKAQLCWIVGTIYMEMPLKPNVLEDIGRDHSIPAPPPPKKIYSENDSITLEDESGRICLTGDRLSETTLVTGVIVAVLGLETPTGEFEVVDICTAGLAPNLSSHATPTDMEVDSPAAEEWIGIVSGLEIGLSNPADTQIQMLTEYLSGEGGGMEEQTSASRISRLLIAGNLFSASFAGGSDSEDISEDKKPRRYAYDSARFSSHPTATLSAYLNDISSFMPVHILPGESDPSGAILPQQPFPRAMFAPANAYSSFVCHTNPTHLNLRSNTVQINLLVNSGQPLSDMFKYVPTAKMNRLSLAESTLRWRHIAPTAPDTLWCHPYFTTDPFILASTPDIYVIGNQPTFQTKIVRDGDQDSNTGPRCRIILVPSFAETGLLVLVCRVEYSVLFVTELHVYALPLNRDDTARNMGGVNLEIFKFGLYLFVPIFTLVHYGDPKWYRDHVVPYREKFFPSDAKLIRHFPHHEQGIRKQLEESKAQNQANRRAREERDASS